jgi:hypothetical protein
MLNNKNFIMSIIDEVGSSVPRPRPIQRHLPPAKYPDSLALGGGDVVVNGSNNTVTIYYSPPSREK